MEKLESTYSEEEQAWFTPKVLLQRDIYLSISLKTPGKVVIRQETANGEFPRVPIKRHKDCSEFRFRISIIPPSLMIQIFTSTEPKDIMYGYI